MRKLIKVLLFAICMPLITNAATGDSTWVQAHSDIWLDHNGNFDTTVEFPKGTTSYRRVYMIFTLGKYQCPGSPQYCGDWDYTVDNYLMTKGGDTVELGRLITPYANAGSARTPWDWKQHYIYDVTDFYTLLKDSATVRINYSGYSWGFTANIKFVFIEGTPARNVMGVTRLWHGYFNYGGATPIDNAITVKNLTAPAGIQSAEMKFNISGHGSDATQCSEFCKKYYQVKVNGAQTEQKDIWRDNCGKNHLYPQSGTWIYDRANWCPGDIVSTNTHKLPGVSAGNTYDLDVDFEAYTTPGAGGAGYGIDASVVYYGGFNHAVDASLEDIIAPSNNETHFRENPVSDKPIVSVMNAGSTTITSLKIEYTVDGYNTGTYTWNGSLASMEKVNITLPEVYDFRVLTGNNNKFTAKIIEVNGGADEDASNNMLKSTFTAVPNWPMAFRVSMRTNNVPNETRWKIYDALNNVVKQRDGTAANTTYTDTVTLGPGAFRFVVEDDGCDGLSWWANSAAGSGTVGIRSLTSLSQFSLSGYFSGDFGCGFTQAFVTGWPTSINTLAKSNPAIELYPNPAADNVHITINSDAVNGLLYVTDMTGRVVIQQKCTVSELDMNTSALVNGVYTVSYYNTSGAVKLQSRLVIAR